MILSLIKDLFIIIVVDPGDVGFVKNVNKFMTTKRK